MMEQDMQFIIMELANENVTANENMAVNESVIVNENVTASENVMASENVTPSENITENENVAPNENVTTSETAMASENELNTTDVLINRNRVIKNSVTPNSQIGTNNKLTEEEKNNFIEMLKKKISKSKILVIDRFEGDLAVCEDRETRKMLNIEVCKLPENVQEGDVIRYKNGEYKLDEEAKHEIEERIRNKLKDLFEV